MNLSIDTNTDIRTEAAATAEIRRVAVICGGVSPEREVSLNSGQAVYEGLRKAGLDAELIDVGDDPRSDLAGVEADLVFIALHGLGGEDGTIQALLGSLGFPHTGSGVAASALAMDKHRTKQMWKAMRFPTAPFKLLHQDSDWTEVLRELDGKVMVKPVREGSSLGLSIAETPDELGAAYQLASQHDSVVIAERWLSGREFSIAILGDEVLPIVEMRTDQAFYNYDAKYFSDSTEYICPARIDEELYKQMQQIAMDAFRALGCSGWGRVDLMLDENGVINLLEANTSPGMTNHSLVPIAAEASGRTFPELVSAIATLALKGAK